MIKFNWLGVLRLSFMVKDLPANRKCWSAGVFGDELLKLFVDICQELNGISGDPNTSESEGEKCHFLIWWFPSQEQCYLVWFYPMLVIKREERRPGQGTVLAKRKELSELLPWTCHLKATLSLCSLAGATVPLPTLPNLAQMAGLGELLGFNSLF